MSATVMSPAATLGPGADPAFSFGLVLNREAIMQPHGRDVDSLLYRNVPNVPEGHGAPDSDGLPKLDYPARIEQWSDDIRHEDLLGELLPRIQIVPNPHHRSVGIYHLGACFHPGEKKVSPGEVALAPICTVQRPSAQVFLKQLEIVHQWAELRAERIQEVITQIGIPLQYWTSLVDLNPTNHRYTLQVLQLGLSLASYVNQPTKHYLACPRPSAYSPAIQPIINPRRFAAFPSGHATEAFILARLLQALSGQSAAQQDEKGDWRTTFFEGQLQRLATRISNNRVVAGVHFPVDATAGRMVAESLAEYLMCRCGERAGWQARWFVGERFVNRDGSTPRLFDSNLPMTSTDAARYFESETVCGPATCAGSSVGSLLAHVWGLAKAEWR